ncbi:MAG: tRNA (cytidine(34)-2'-O)-methyltransferase [Chlamydiae bacterium]|nr:tRNA (cytidine(34)-2'-O)-methyltransferase [Chlamydiota bacterium]
MNVVLFEPQIPQNTGNIVRTCAVRGSRLFLVKPLGFSVTNRWLKRAGLDYWEGVEVNFIDDLNAFLQNASNCFYFFSAHAEKLYTQVQYSENDYLIFGSETAGLPREFWDLWPEQFYTIPKRPETRCLNLANAVSVVLYESWRQQDFTIT